MMLRWKLPESGFPGQYLKPGPFFAGIIIGFITCCLLGFLCSKVNTLGDLVRFDHFTTIYTTYIPTAQQFMSRALSQSRPDQILVIVGGDSVFHGYGQPNDELWTVHLQKELGDRYCVINYSIDGTESFEGSYWLAEALFKQNRQVIFLTDAEPDQGGCPLGRHLRWLYYDFANRGMLIDFDKRNKGIEEALRFERFTHLQTLDEFDLCTKVDRFTHSADLWNFVSYNAFCTIWTHGTGNRFYYPRRYFRGIFAPWEIVTYSVADVLKESPHLKRREGELVQKDPAGNWKYTDDFHAHGQDEARDTLAPTSFRKNIIVFLSRLNPLLYEDMTEEERSRNTFIYNMAENNWLKLGYGALQQPSTFTPDDFLDVNHYSVKGGKKVAHMVAEKVRQVAKELGYEK